MAKAARAWLGGAVRQDALTSGKHPLYRSESSAFGNVFAGVVRVGQASGWHRGGCGQLGFLRRGFCAQNGRRYRRWARAQRLSARPDSRVFLRWPAERARCPRTLRDVPSRDRAARGRVSGQGQRGTLRRALYGVGPSTSQAWARLLLQLVRRRSHRRSCGCAAARGVYRGCRDSGALLHGRARVRHLGSRSRAAGSLPHRDPAA